MKKIHMIKIYVCILLPLLILSACSDRETLDVADNGVKEGSSSVETTLTGVVADGYLKDAKVFLDRNKNQIYDDGEPLTQTTAGGVFRLEVSPGEGELYPVVAQVVAGQTIDEDSGSEILNGYYLESLPGRWKFISPLTTLVKLECDKNPSISPQQAEIAIRTRFGLDDSISLFSDFMTPASEEAAVVDEYGRVHRAAQIIAGTMGSLRSKLFQALDGRIDATEQLLVAYLVSDRILWQAPLIRSALDNERNQTGIMDVATVMDAILAASDVGGLDAEVLVRYQQRLEQNFATWDMRAPQLQRQIPFTDDTASVDVVVSITFDEALDETLLVDGVMTVSGPHGEVSGRLDYDAECHQLNFIPSHFLVPFGHYQVTVAGMLADSLGNPLGEDITWEFTTIFDQTPPPLPVF